MSAENAQTTLLGKSGGGHVEIETDGRFIRPMFNIPDALVSEGRFRFTEDGLTASMVDPANVGMCEFRVPAEAFGEYEYNADGPLYVGLILDTVSSHLRDARMGKETTDAVSLRIDGTMTRVAITRDYARCEVERTDEWLNIDPDSVRESPELPDLDLPYKAEVDVQALADVVKHVDSFEDHVKVAERDGELVLSGAAKNSDGELAQATEARFHGVTEPTREDVETGVSSLFSLEYIKDFVDGLRFAKADSVTLYWGDEFPIRMVFERTDEDDRLLYEGEYMMAPRLDSGD